MKNVFYDFEISDNDEAVDYMLPSNITALLNTDVHMLVHYELNLSYVINDDLSMVDDDDDVWDNAKDLMILYHCHD